MNTRPSPIKAALLGTAMLGQSLIAAPAVAGDEKSAAPPAPAAAPAAPASEQANATQAANLALAKDLDASTAANAKAKEFLEKTGLTTPSDPSPTDTPAAQPIDFQPGPNDSTIQCDGGMYFNGDEGVFVYLKNVRVNDPRFTLTGANELKIFLGKKPQDPTKKKPDAAPAKDENKDTTDKEPNKGFSKFNEVERIVATGAILVEQKQTDQSKTPAKASGAIFSYNIKEDLATITGGYPWLLSNGICVRAKEPNLIVRMQPKAGRASTDPGPWETIVNVEQLQKKK